MHGYLLTDELVATAVSSLVTTSVFPAVVSDCLLSLDAKAIIIT
jgi:hypothetical protein